MFPEPWSAPTTALPNPGRKQPTFPLPNPSRVRAPPLTKMGRLFHARSLSITTTLPSHAQSIHGRMNAPVPCYWCVPSSTTYLLVQHFVPNLDGHALDPIIINTLRSAWTGVRNYMATHGDGLVPGGEFQFGRSGFGWYSVNVNNHQLTYGVVLTALNALLAFMTYNGRYGMATFWIFDGINLVGRGVFGPG